MTRPPRFVPLLFALTLALSGCGYNAVQSGDEAVKAQWTEILTQYRQRSELVPQLVALVQQHARHEREVLKRVTEARARASAIPGDESLLADEDAFRRYERLQGALSGALSRLLAVSNDYPELQADNTFRDLVAQLQATEAHIAASRHKYREVVTSYNATIHSFPSVLSAKLLGATERPTLVEDGAQGELSPAKVAE